MGVIDSPVSYRDSVREVVLGRAGPYGFVIAIVAVTLGLYGSHGAPTAGQAIGLLAGGCAGLMIAAALGLRRSSPQSAHERLPETWLDLHPVAVVCSAVAGLVTTRVPDASVAWAAAAAVTGFTYVLVAAAELSVRQRREGRRARAAEEKMAAVELAAELDPDEWRERRMATIASLVELPGGENATRAGEPRPEPALETASAPEPEPKDEARPEPEPEPAPEPAAQGPPEPAPAPELEPLAAELTDPEPVPDPVPRRLIVTAPAPIRPAPASAGALATAVVISTQPDEGDAEDDESASSQPVPVATAAEPMQVEPVTDPAIVEARRVPAGGPRRPRPRSATSRLLRRHRTEIVIVAAVAVAGVVLVAHSYRS